LTPNALQSVRGGGDGGDGTGTIPAMHCGVSGQDVTLTVLLFIG